jgi:hypothetical protein
MRCRKKGGRKFARKRGWKRQRMRRSGKYEVTKRKVVKWEEKNYNKKRRIEEDRRIKKEIEEG